MIFSNKLIRACCEFAKVMLVVTCCSIDASSSRGEEPLLYNRDIRPILAENCFACHGPDSAARKADLRLDHRDAAIEMGAITAGEPDESEMIARITTDDAELLMPPPETKKKLTQDEIETLKKWVASGAAYQQHWSFIAPQMPELPTVQKTAWVKNVIDRFVLSKLEENNLSPAQEANPHALYRRLHLDITGLPPVPEDVDAFVKDYQSRGDEALSAWIDKLMNTNAWGEHRARYWLDAARYADTHGLHFDNYREMWPYRDWVIRAFNANQPFDQFTLEQIAGDLLPNPTKEQLIATGFQRCNMTTNEGGTIDEENLANYAVDRVQTMGWVYLGLTTNCAQCHDHKFDSFTMRDFYSMAAFFRNTTQQAKDGNVKDGLGPFLVMPSDADKSRWEELPSVIATAIAKRDERKTKAVDDFQQWMAKTTPQSLDAVYPANELLVHVPLNEGTGNEVKNLAGTPATFAASGDVTWNPDGKIGPAPVLNSNSTFDLGEQGDFEKAQAFSVGIWIKTAAEEQSGSILARMDEDTALRGWELGLHNNALTFHLVDSWPDSAIKVVTRKKVIKPGQWHLVYLTYDGSGKSDGIKLYVNGAPEKVNVEKNTLQSDAVVRATTSLQVGRRGQTNLLEGGAVQDIRIYGRALGAEEIKKISQLSDIQDILKIAAEKRSQEQRDSLYEYYLNDHDPEFPSLVQTVTTLEAEREEIRARSPLTHIQQERMDTSPVAYVLMRGEYDKPGEKVSAATPAGLHPLPEGAPHNRLGLAQWLIDPANPLTARVTVNRFWQEVFGQGLVTTPEDFGVMGADPSHPELLDWLAVEFRSSGWDVKKFFKLIFMSAAYRQSAITTEEKIEKDRANALLSRGPRFRMDAEMVRDYALAVSGLLSEKMYGPGVKPYQPGDIWNIVGLPGGNTRDYVQSQGDGLYRRTVYSFWKRMAPPPNLEAFNAPSREVCTVRRERTNTPLQALVTLNDPQFVEAARRLAEIALKSSGDDETQAITILAKRALSRSLNQQEQDLVRTNLQSLLAHYRSQPEDAKSLIAVGESKADESIDSAKLAAWTMLANQVLNLDETLNK